MAKIPAETVERWAGLVDRHFDLTGHGERREHIVLGKSAWTLAHRVGILDEAYGNTAKDMPGIEGVNDAHIQTALERIFPEAVFNDPKRY